MGSGGAQPPATTMSEGAAAVSVTGIDKSFAGHPVLSGIDLDAEPGSITALLGPSGCGKTTLLRVVAGLERPDAGSVSIGGQTMVGPGQWVSPESRQVGMVFQDWALFPHLSVKANVAFGLPKRDRKGPRVAAVLDMVGLGPQADRLPGTLSGGQQQRVALARALAPEPRVLLLDEPFSNLDTTLRQQVRRDVRALLREISITAVFVTHDQDEAFYLGEQVVVLNGGHVVQHGPASDLYERPVSPWLAGFVGEANLVPGTGRGPVADTILGVVELAEPTTGPVTVLLRPEHIGLRPAVGETLDGGSAGHGVVVEIEYHGHDCTYVVAVSDTTVRARSDEAGQFAAGDRVAVTATAPAARSWHAEQC